MTEECVFCSEDKEAVLQRHHQVPRRHGGKDVEYNMITLCANCHQVVENLYDDDFFERVGVNTGIEPEDKSISHEEAQEFPSVQDVAEEFARECCQHQPGASTSSSSLMRAFNEWVEDNGYSYTQDTYIALQFILRNAPYAEWVKDKSWQGKYSIHIPNMHGRFLEKVAEEHGLDKHELAAKGVARYLKEEFDDVPDDLDEMGKDLDFMTNPIIEDDDPMGRNPARTTLASREDYEWMGRVDGLKLNLP